MRAILLMRLMLAVGVVGYAGFLGAEDAFSKLSDTERQQVNAWMAERAKRMITAYQLDTQLSQAWGNDAYTSPEIDALRKRYRELQQELRNTQFELKKKVMEIPALKEKQKQLDQEKETIKQLSIQVNEKAGMDLQHTPLPSQEETRENANGEAEKQ